MPILVGFIVGFFTSIPPSGPVAISVIQTALKKGARFGFMIGIGAAMIDALYLLIGLFVSGEVIMSFLNEYSYIIKLIGTCFLIILGIKEIKTSKIDYSAKVAIKPRKRKYFALGIMYMVTNPIVLGSYIGIAIIIQGYALFEHNMTNNILLATSLAAGTSAWFLTLSLILRKYKSKVSEQIIVKINQISGYLFIVFGLSLAYSVIMDLIQ